jgi:hypothetical protein
VQNLPTRIESTKDIGFRIATAREITKEISRFRSIFPGSLALLERMGIASVDIVDLNGLSIEALMHIKEAYYGQRLGLELLQKTMLGSGKGTSLATQQALMITKDPDARFKDMIANGDVSFSDVSLVESLHGLFPYAAWVAQVAFTYFIGELP